MGVNYKVAMENRMDDLERRLDEVVWLLRDTQQVWPRSRSLPKRGHHQVE